MKKLFLFLFIIGLIASPAYSENLKAPQEAHLSKDLNQLSEWLGQLQKGLKEVSEIEKIWIGGGSARAILDHLYFGKPLEMRDLDIFVIANKEVTSEFVEKIGSHLNGDRFGFFSRKDLRSRPRVPLDKPILTRNHYVAGFGLHWIRSNGEIMDLSVYHSKDDLDLNGIFDIDTIMIPLDHLVSLVDFAKKTEELTYYELVSEGSIYDRYFGYEKWQSGEVNIVNWLDIESDPLLKVCRVVRTLLKNNRSYFTPEELSNFRYLLRQASVDNPLQMTRSLLKILEDTDALLELRLLKEIGVFNYWLTPFNQCLFEKIEMQDVSPLTYGRGERLALARLVYLIDQIPNQNKRLETMFDALAPFDLGTLVTWIHRELIQEEHIYDENISPSLDRLGKICKSGVLSAEEKKELFLRELEGDWVQRKGVVTGVFNPVHLGHIELFEEAVQEMVLDELIVVPSFGEPLFDPPIAWEERYAMLKLIEKDVAGLKIISPEYRKQIKEGSEFLIRFLLQEDPNAEWVRVLGSDNALHYFEQGRYDQEVCPQILIIQRGDLSLYPEAADLDKIYLKEHHPGSHPIQKRHQGKNARKLARNGEDTSLFVPKKVAAYIQECNLYLDENKLHCLSTNENKLAIVSKIFPQCDTIPVDLPLNNQLSPEAAIREKMQRAMSYGKLPVVVIEQFIKIKALSDRFIPLSDFTLQSLGTANIATLLEARKNGEATLWTLVACADSEGQVRVHQERLKGTLDPLKLRHAPYFDPNQQLKTEAKGHPLERVLRKLKKEKIGILTGVFNPIHLGHLEAVKVAKKELGLDRVILIPTPATRHNERPLAWETRLEMARIAICDEEGIEVITQDFHPSLKKGTGSALAHLAEEYPNSEFWHLMGSDSFERFQEQGHLQRLPPRFHVGILERTAFKMSLDNPRVKLVKLPPMKREEERASHLIRQYLKEGRPLQDLVPPPVETYIKERSLYETMCSNPCDQERT